MRIICGDIVYEVLINSNIKNMGLKSEIDQCESFEGSVEDDRTGQQAV